MTTLNDKIYGKLVEIGKSSKQNTVQLPRFLGLKITLFIIAILASASFEIYNFNQILNKFFSGYPNTEQAFQDFGEMRISFYPKNVQFDRKAKDYAKYGISQNALRLKFGGITGFFRGNIDIPATAIEGCSQSSNGKNSRNTYIILKNPEFGFVIADSAHLKDWCFANHLPAFTNRELSDWRYKNVPLPSGQVIADRLKSKENYEFTLKQACMGY